MTADPDTQHDLHVSTDLGGLPPQWIDSLREQGLSEQDLLMISSARANHRSVSQPVPLRPLHREHSVTSSYPDPATNNSGPGHDRRRDAKDEDRVEGSKPNSRIHKKFSFEPTSPQNSDGPSRMSMGKSWLRQYEAEEIHDQVGGMDAPLTRLAEGFEKAVRSVAELLPTAPRG
jgi:hypothetical protein